MPQYTYYTLCIVKTFQVEWLDTVIVCIGDQVT